MRFDIVVGNKVVWFIRPYFPILSFCHALPIIGIDEIITQVDITLNTAYNNGMQRNMHTSQGIRTHNFRSLCYRTETLSDM
jgi:hypothetical protein